MATYNRADTTARIFEAAGDEFATYGIAGARVDRIAENASSSKALIYSYFGDKESLFVQVLQSRLTELASAVVLQPDRAGEFVGDLFDFMTAHPDVLRLVIQESMHFTPAGSPDFASRSTHYRTKIDALERAQASGAVDPTLDPAFVLLSLMGLVSWFVAAPQITLMVAGDAPDLNSRYRAHLIELAERLLRPRDR